MTFTWFFPNPNGAYGQTATSDPQADPVTHAISLIAASLALTGATAATVVESAKVTADAANRFTLGADGKLSWGNGSGAVDTVLSRTAANELTLAAGDTLKADTFTASGTTTGDIVNALTGYRIAGAAGSGKYLRGNGTSFVSGDIADADIPATIARDTEALLQSLAAAKGDIPMATGVGVWGKTTVGANGTFLQADSAQSTNGKWTIPKIDNDQKVRSGNKVLNEADLTWHDTDTALDMVRAATAGDKFHIEIEGSASNENVSAWLDVRTLAGSNYVSGGTDVAGSPGLAWIIAGVFQHYHASITYPVVSGDISGGNVTFRLRHKVGTISSNRTLIGSGTTTPGLRVRAFNLGQ